VTSVRFLPAARSEFLESLRYYRSRSPRVAREFLESIRESIATILQFPEAAPVLRGPIRRRIVRRFPFSLLYSIENAAVLIVAVMHHHRHPDYWVNRVDGG